LGVNSIVISNNNNNDIKNVPAKSEDATPPVKPGCGWKENGSIC
jgi:hypothetical protein